MNVILDVVLNNNSNGMGNERLAEYVCFYFTVAGITNNKIMSTLTLVTWENVAYTHKHVTCRP